MAKFNADKCLWCIGHLHCATDYWDDVHKVYRISAQCFLLFTGRNFWMRLQFNWKTGKWDHFDYLICLKPTDDSHFPLVEIFHSKLSSLLLRYHYNTTTVWKWVFTSLDINNYCYTRNKINRLWKMLMLKIHSVSTYFCYSAVLSLW